MQKEALSKADRLNLIPLYPRPSAPVALYALTPGTSFPGKTTRLHAGRKEERAFLTALLGRTYPHLMRKFPADTMKRNVRSDWEGLVQYYRARVSQLPRAFLYAFKAALTKEFNGSPKTRLPEISNSESAGRFVGRLRRALGTVIPTETLALPWVAPSVSWWDLRGAWADSVHEPKLLLFSRFKSTPQSIAALTSLGVEARYLGRSGGYETVWKRRRLQAAPNRLPVVALFHPSPLLIFSTDPLATPRANGAPPREVIRKQLVAVLKKLSVQIVKGPGKKSARRKPLWVLLSALERLGGYSELTRRAWRAVAGDDQRLRNLLEDWHENRELDWISRRELDDLVTAALSAPGVIVGRALLRHFPQALSTECFEEAVHVAWHGLRAYHIIPPALSSLRRASRSPSVH